MIYAGTPPAHPMPDLSAETPDQKEVRRLRQTLAAYVALVERESGFTWVPPAVTQRGAQWIASSPPEAFTEAMFRDVLAAEIEALGERTAAPLVTCLKRREHILRAG